jgi:hypothetical protein
MEGDCGKIRQAHGVKLYNHVHSTFIAGLPEIPPHLGLPCYLSPVHQFLFGRRSCLRAAPGEVSRVPPVDRPQRLLTPEIAEYALIVCIRPNGSDLQGTKSRYK